MPWIDVHPLNTDLSNLIEPLKENGGKPLSEDMKQVIKNLEGFKAQGLTLHSSQIHDNTKLLIKDCGFSPKQEKFLDSEFTAVNWCIEQTDDTVTKMLEAMEIMEKLIVKLENKNI